MLIVLASLAGTVAAQTGADAETLPRVPSAASFDSASGSSAEDLLALLPADTIAVVVARSLTDLDARSTALLKRLDLPTHPSMPLLASLGVMAGVDASRAAGVAILTTETPVLLPGGLVLLLPTTSPEALLVMLEPKPVEDGFWRVSIRGTESFVGFRDGYAVFGAALSMVKRVVAVRSSLAPRLSVAQRERLRADDVFAWFDGAVASRAGGGAMDAWMQRVSGVSIKALSQYTDGSASVRFDPKGLRLGFLLRPHSADPAGDVSASIVALAAGWSGQPGAVAVEVVNGRSGARARWLLAWATKRLLDAGVIDSTRVSELSAAFLAVADAVDVANLQVTLAPDDTDGRVAVTLLLHTHQGVKAPLASIQRLVGLLAGDVVVDPNTRLALKRLTYAHAAETVSEIPVDHVALDVADLAAVDADAVRAAFGSDGLLARVGVVDGNPTVITLGGGSARFAGAVAAVRSMRPAILLDSEREETAGASSLFFKSRMAIDQWLTLRHVVSLVTGTGAAAPVIPVLGESVTLTMGRTASGATDVELFLPVDLLVAIRDGSFSGRSVTRDGGR